MNGRFKKARRAAVWVLLVMLAAGATLYVLGFLWTMWNVYKMDW